MNISREEAAQALGAIEASRSTMRAIVRSYRGHYLLWLWGGIWAVMALAVQFYGQQGIRFFPWIGGTGMVASLAIRCAQSGTVRMPVDKRFLRLLLAIIIFAFVWPLVLGLPPNPKVVFAYFGLVAMFYYVVAGIWFDMYLLWVGLVVSGLIVAGLLFFPAIFWWWIAIVCGGTLVGTGFYVRFFWR
jgi:hypothetical protein